MPRRIQPPAYLLHKASGQARCRVSGRDIYLGAYGSPESRTAYRKLLDDWETAQANADKPAFEPVKPTRLTVGTVLLRYEDFIAKQGSQNRVKRAHRALAVVRELYSHTPAAAFGLDCLEAVRAAMIGRGWERRYINCLVTVVKRCWRWAASKSLVPLEAYQQLALLEGLHLGTPNTHDNEPVEPVDPAVVEATLPHLLAPVAAMVRLQMLTGMRPGEVSGMRPVDIDRTADVWVYRPAQHKNKHRGQKRAIHLGPQAQEILRPFLDRPPETYCFSPREALAGRRGGGRKDLRDRYDSMVYPRAIMRAAAKAGVPHWHPNQLRHTVATP